MDQIKIGTLISELRKEKQLTQEQLGEKQGPLNITKEESVDHIIEYAVQARKNNVVFWNDINFITTVFFSIRYFIRYWCTNSTFDGADSCPGIVVCDFADENYILQMPRMWEIFTIFYGKSKNVSALWIVIR